MTRLYAKTSAGIAVATVFALIMMAGATAGATGSAPIDEFAFDLDVSGNTADEIGEIQDCASLEVGSTLEIDAVLTGIRDGQLIGGVGMDLVFDPAVLAIDEVVGFSGPTFLTPVGDGGSVEVVDYDANDRDPDSDGPPGVTGDVRIDMGRVDQEHPFVQQGVITRFRVRAVGPGISLIRAGDIFRDGSPDVPLVIDSLGYPLQVNAVSHGVVVVGGAVCPPAEEPTSYPTSSPRPVARLLPVVSAPKTVRPGETFTVTFTLSSPDADVQLRAMRLHFEPHEFAVRGCSFVRGSCTANGLSGWVDLQTTMPIRRGETFDGSVEFSARDGPSGSSNVRISGSGTAVGYDVHTGSDEATILIASPTPTPTPIRSGSPPPGGRGGDGPRALPDTGGEPGGGMEAPAVVAGAALSVLGAAVWGASRGPNKGRKPLA